MPPIGTCFRFYTQIRVQKKKKHLHIKFIVTSHNSVCFRDFLTIKKDIKKDTRKYELETNLMKLF